MKPRTLTIATRQSRLALWQAEHVRARLQSLHQDLHVELLAMRTEGDRFLDAPLAQAGGKGLFIKELEHALLDRRADLAVHSMKDVPIELPQALAIPAILARADARDVFLSQAHASFEALPAASLVGTSSLRRRSQLQALRRDVRFANLRGNIDTRLGKLRTGDYDAIVLAAAGLDRLGLTAAMRQPFATDVLVPAIAQGAIGIECRADDVAVHALLAPLADPATTTCVLAERAVNTALEGGCHLPIAGHAVLHGGVLRITALVGDESGEHILRDAISGAPAEAERLGRMLGERMLRQGGGALIAALQQSNVDKQK
ncbi:MAG: hydroxymethylbilane synthase [Gammaproteobacteria bacterium]|nr:hydroxymethylbilane synthase [Gammaproteobacteria bacterium]